MNPDMLRTAPIFASISDEELSRLAASFEFRTFPAGTILFREGDVGDSFYILLSGEIEVVKAMGTSEERLLSVLGAGDFLGEMSLFETGGARSASVRTRSEVAWAEITSQAFESLLHHQPALTVRLAGELNKRLRRSEADTIRDLQVKNQALTQAYFELQQAQAKLVENEKLEHELEIAREIQQSILPKTIPVLQDWEIRARWQPARAVSGDFYDFLPHPDGKLGLLIADVTGKGVPAALVMAVTCSTLRSVAGSETSPGAILERVNNILCDTMPKNMFVTCLYGLLEPKSGEFRFANAGHNLPAKVTPGKIQELRATGMPLGLLPGMRYIENVANLEAGSSLVLYTDGIVEAHNASGEMFGSARLQESLVETACRPEAIDHLLGRLAEFTGAAWEQEDDVTFVVLTHVEG